jgi:hypothetical protein
MGTASFDFSESCITSTSNLSSADFFEDLLVRQTSSGVEFFQQSHPVKDFPTTLTVETIFLIQRCSDRKLETADASEEILKRLRFKLEWKRGLEVRPVADFSHRLIQPAAFHGGFRDPRMVVWTVQLIVKDSGIPLTDDLVLRILVDDGKLLARFAARL